jgi:hypothetical protein
MLAFLKGGIIPFAAAQAQVAALLLKITGGPPVPLLKRQ